MEMTATILAILATIGFSTVTMLVAGSTKKIGAIPTLFLSQLIGIPLFLFLIPIAPTVSSAIHPLPILIIGACFSFIYLLFLHATKIGILSVVSTVNQLYMVVAIGLGILLLGESFTFWKFIGMATTLLGIALIGLQLPSKKIKRVTLLSGVPFALMSAIGTGIYLFSVAIAARTDGWFFTALFIRIGIALTMFITLMLRQFNFSSLLKSVPWKILMIAAAVDVGAFSLYNYTVATYEVATPTIITASQAALIALFSWKFLKERLTKQQIAGVIIVLCGLISIHLQ